MAELISRRGTLECRVCGSSRLQSILDLGNQPLPAEYGQSQEDELTTLSIDFLKMENDLMELVA